MELQDQKKQEKPAEPARDAAHQDFEELELSDTWRQLLGLQEEGATVDLAPTGEASSAAPALPVEPLPNDPWSELVQARGTEVIDLQRLHTSHAPLSEQDVEQALEVIQEKPASEQGTQQSS
jgi:hypothetical protein